MSKKFKKAHNRVQRESTLTEIDLENMAKSLVQRGLASRGILDRSFKDRNLNRTSHFNQANSIERFFHDYTY